MEILRRESKAFGDPVIYEQQLYPLQERIY